MPLPGQSSGCSNPGPAMDGPHHGDSWRRLTRSCAEVRIGKGVAGRRRGRPSGRQQQRRGRRRLRRRLGGASGCARRGRRLRRRCCDGRKVGARPGSDGGDGSGDGGDDGDGGESRRRRPTAANAVATTAMATATATTTTTQIHPQIPKYCRSRRQPPTLSSAPPPPVAAPPPPRPPVPLPPPTSVGPHIGVANRAASVVRTQGRLHGRQQARTQQPISRAASRGRTAIVATTRRDH